MFSSHQLLRVADSFWRLSNHASNQPYFKVMQLTDSMEPAKGLEPLTSGLRKRWITSFQRLRRFALRSNLDHLLAFLLDLSLAGFV
jgi:hypothetical protein